MSTTTILNPPVFAYQTASVLTPDTEDVPDRRLDRPAKHVAASTPTSGHMGHMFSPVGSRLTGPPAGPQVAPTAPEGRGA